MVFPDSLLPGVKPAHLSTFNTFDVGDGPWAGTPAPLLGCKRAAQDLKGGGSSLLEGLEDSGRPCTQVLSVAGFLALLAPFPGWEVFILRGEEAHSLPGRPLFFNPLTKSVKLYTPMCGSMVPSRAVYTRGGWEAAYLRVYIGRHIPGCIPPGYIGGHIQEEGCTYPTMVPGRLPT